MCPREAPRVPSAELQAAELQAAELRAAELRAAETGHKSKHDLRHMWPCRDDGPFRIIYEKATGNSRAPWEATCFTHPPVGQALCKKSLAINQEGVEAVKLRLYMWCNEACQHGSKSTHQACNPRAFDLVSEEAILALAPSVDAVNSNRMQLESTTEPNSL